ncbi:MAG TPA: DegT/DnrJ/EryC1/StrS family aminotransferase [Thermoplasmata archaeon]|nr:DegT/DnrJ/EryC1/StrS family aminotransferase [Thermoplasmata archaeon]HLB67821.1 DegT/DnrJ/EryC1/StrS family aminotransferase [Thermoplasmata archaeon]
MSDAKRSPIPPTRIFFPDEDIDALQGVFRDILKTGQLTLGKRTGEFENRFAAEIRGSHAIAVNSGTSALEIILRALRLSDSEVIVPTNTFAATAFAVVHSGNRPALADIGEDLCLSMASVESALTRRTKAIILVHIGGLVARDTIKIADFCRDKGIALVEDAAHAHGSTLNDKPAGSFGIGSAFSFYPTKVMTSGEGGMIVTNDGELAKTAKILRDQGKAGFTTNLHVEMGYNWRLSELHAAIGLSQLGRLREFIERRRQVAKTYDFRLRTVGWLEPLVPSQGVRSNYYKYIAFLDHSVSRTALKSKLKERLGISLAGEVYDVPLHRQPIFQKFGLGNGQKFRLADDLCERHICLPMSAVMTEAEALRVVEGLEEVKTWLQS